MHDIIQNVLGLAWSIFCLWALVQILMEDNELGPKMKWVFIIVITGGLGVVLYYLFGRDKDRP